MFLKEMFNEKSVFSNYDISGLFAFEKVLLTIEKVNVNVNENDDECKFVMTNYRIFYQTSSLFYSIPLMTIRNVEMKKKTLQIVTKIFERYEVTFKSTEEEEQVMQLISSFQMHELCLTDGGNHDTLFTKYRTDNIKYLQLAPFYTKLFKIKVGENEHFMIQYILNPKMW